MGVNKVILLGNVGRDPEVRHPEKDMMIAAFPLATSESRGGQEITEWHNIVMVGRLAELAERYIRKGSKLYVEGKLRTREYEDKLKVRRWRTEIYADNVELLGRPQTAAPQQ